MKFPIFYLWVCFLFCSAISPQKAADLFLSKNKEDPKIVAVTEKLQYEIIRKGSGSSVRPYSKPLISYLGKYLQGPSIPPTETFCDLDEAFLGFQKGLVGMKEGEVRLLYIHPEWGDHTSLMMVEVTVIQADASMDIHAASNQF